MELHYQIEILNYGEPDADAHRRIVRLLNEMFNVPREDIPNTIKRHRPVNIKTPDELKIEMIARRCERLNVRYNISKVIPD